MEKFHELEVKSMMNFVKTRGFKCFVRPFSAPFQLVLEMGRKSTNIYVFKKKKKIPTEIKIVIDFNRVRVRITEDRHSSK